MLVVAWKSGVIKLVPCFHPWGFSLFSCELRNALIVTVILPSPDYLVVKAVSEHFGAPYCQRQKFLDILYREKVGRTGPFCPFSLFFY